MKIAFLFLTVDNVHFPNIWSRYFKNNEQYYNIYCHAKHPNLVTVQWQKDNFIDNHVETAWGKIVNAYFELIKYAMLNKDNMKFVVISESDVPLQSFKSFYNFLVNDNIKTSYIKLFDHNYNSSIELRIKTMSEHSNYDITYIKHFARFCLSRYHCKQLLSKNENMIKFFSNMLIGDEHFLSMLNMNDGYIKNVLITYDNWEIVLNKIQKLKKQIWKLKDSGGSEKKIQELTLERNNLRNSPYTYTFINNKMVKDAIKTGCFFWRKMSKTCNIEENKLYMKHVFTIKQIGSGKSIIAFLSKYNNNHATTLRQHYELLDMLNRSLLLQENYKILFNEEYDEISAHYKYFKELI